MTHVPSFPPVDGMPMSAAHEVFATAAAMSESTHAGVARWAGGLFAALIGQLTSGRVEITDAPIVPLSVLDDAELRGLTEFFADPKRAFHPDAGAAAWYRATFKMLVAEPDRRHDAAALEYVDWQQWEYERVTGRDSDTSDLPAWSTITRPADDEQ